MHTPDRACGDVHAVGILLQLRSRSRNSADHAQDLGLERIGKLIQCCLFLGRRTILLRSL